MKVEDKLNKYCHKDFVMYLLTPSNNIIIFRARTPGAEIKFKFYGEKNDYTFDELYEYWKIKVNNNA